MIRYFLYARKSTDDEERQILSIDAQLTELRDFALKEKLFVVEEFIESKTAKTPGRPVFNSMMQRIQNGEADGLLAWHPDRLARNSVDGGLIIYLLDTDHLKALKFPTFWFENTPQGKFMLSIAFGQSKYYVDNLRENILRGIRQKLRRGEFPGKPPIGYLNEPKLRTIVIDEARSPLVKRMFEAYATGRYSVPELRELVTAWGLRTGNGCGISRSKMWYVLANHFYIGFMRIKGELYEGSHPPLISKELFDKVQALLLERSKSRYKQKAPFAFPGLLRCAECGCAITAERQKGHHYYHCTKKSGPCFQRGYVREELLAEQLRNIVQQLALPETWVAPVREQFDTWAKESKESNQAVRQTLEAELLQVNLKMERLLDAHLEGIVTHEEYLPRKEQLLYEKNRLQEQLGKLSLQGNLWLEPMRQFIETCIDAGSVAQKANAADIAMFLKTAGSNLLLEA